jgi:RNA polymerase sigma factor (sigma-70 family)
MLSVRSGDGEAATQLWDCCFGRMVHIARRGIASRRAIDPEDVALSAFHVACRGLAQGRFDAVQHRDEFWALLVTLLRRKISEHARRLGRQKRGGGSAQVEMPLDEIPSSSCDPALLTIGAVILAELVESLPDESLRLVARWKVEGLTLPEISERLDCSTPTVKRKLALIRECWTIHFDD